MPIWVEIEKLAHVYRRKGGKTNRRGQVKRIRKTCEWIDAHHQVGSIHRIGKKHIIDFYRYHRHLAPATLERGYHYAMCELWRWLERPGEPPKPRIGGEK